MAEDSKEKDVPAFNLTLEIGEWVVLKCGFLPSSVFNLLAELVAHSVC